ncbi:MAG: hypothetical protein IPK89_00625 [Sphingomonadales bacterium]|nr:hypothetical protein [Sphingomonadales bacterium]
MGYLARQIKVAQNFSFLRCFVPEFQLVEHVIVKKLSFLAAAALCAAGCATPAFAAQPIVTIPSCATIGLDDIVPNALACAGYFQGNLLNTANLTEQTNALAGIGLTWNGITLEKLDPGAAVLNFNTVLNGLTWIGIHYGAGQGPVNAPGRNRFLQVQCGHQS